MSSTRGLLSVVDQHAQLSPQDSISKKVYSTAKGDKSHSRNPSWMKSNKSRQGRSRPCIIASHPAVRTEKKLFARLCQHGLDVVRSNIDSFQDTQSINHTSLPFSNTLVKQQTMLSLFQPQGKIIFNLIPKSETKRRMGDLHRERGKSASCICLSFYDTKKVLCLCSHRLYCLLLLASDKVSFVVSRDLFDREKSSEC
jgi:hypothetical protein